MEKAPFKYPLMVVAIAMLLLAAWGGLQRMGWALPQIEPGLILAHGPLMVSGFFGTLIALERAVALRKLWTYLPPTASALGGLLLVFGVGKPLAGSLFVLASVGLLAVFGLIVRRHPAVYTWTMALGAAAWLVGNLLWWAGWPVFQLVLWWAAFLILTIAGERLELGRMQRWSGFVLRLFVLATGLFLVGLVIALILHDLGVRIAALGLLGLAVWLLRYDIARRTINREGLPRFAAICLLSGYVWLAFAAGIGLYAGTTGGYLYDALLHAIFLGFVFSMILGHAPIIFPAVLGLPIQFSRLSYAPLGLLHFSLFLRVLGDLLHFNLLRRWGGMFNGITILLFLIVTILVILRSRRSEPEPVREDALAREPGS